MVISLRYIPRPPSNSMFSSTSYCSHHSHWTEKLIPLSPSLEFAITRIVASKQFTEICCSCSTATGNQGTKSHREKTGQRPTKFWTSPSTQRRSTVSNPSILSIFYHAFTIPHLSILHCFRYYLVLFHPLAKSRQEKGYRTRRKQLLCENSQCQSLKMRYLSALRASS